jgi:outer membrane receptor protein involved in Fe transport
MGAYNSRDLAAIDRVVNLRKKILVYVYGLLACMLVISCPTFAQVSGATLSGNVTDQSGSAVADAQVAIKNTATGISVNVNANSDGFYSVPNLQPGTYEVTIAATGFSTSMRSGVVLTVGEQQVLNFAMQVGSVSQTIEVTGEAPAIELTSSAISGVVNSTTVVELPLNGRDWTLLATLVPSVNPIATQLAIGANAPRGQRGFGSQLTISGTRPQANNYRIDGVSVNDYAGGGPGSVSGFALGVDAVAEFSVITSNYSAEYGRTSGGIINAITRSGSNQFHGDAYGFLRGAALDARGYFDKGAPPPFHRNQYGGSLGGPIRKEKTFFFVDGEVFRQGQGNTVVDKVPSNAARTGLIHEPLGTPGCVSTNNASDPTQCQVTVDPTIATYLKFWPIANGAALGPDTAIYNTALNDNVHDNFLTVRIDHRFSEKDSLSGTYLYDSALNDQPDPLDDTLFGNTSSRQTISLQETHVFSATVTNAVRFGYNRVTTFSNDSLAAINPLSAQPSLGAFNDYASQANVSGLTTFDGGLGGLGAPFHYWNTFQGYDDAFLVKGNHVIKFGVSFERDQQNVHFPGGDGTFIFGSLYDFLTNQPLSFRGSPIVVDEGLRQSIAGAYVQDDWKIRPNLTLNLGLRYEMATVPTDRENHLVNLRTLTSPTPTLGSPLFSNPTLRNFEPRVGLAWDPFHNGKTSVRAAFGIFDVLPLLDEFYIMQIESAPYSENVSGANLPQGAFPTGLNGFTADPAKLQTAWIQPNPPRNYVMIWNLNIQRQLSSSMTASVGYVGNHGVHMYNREDDINTVQPTQTSIGLLFPLGTGPSNRINPNVGDIRGGYWGGTSSYNALQASFTKSFSHGVQAQASYTWGKGFDTGSATDIGDPFTNSISSPFNFWPGRYGLSDYNIAHTFVLNFIWDIPARTNWSSVASHILGGWEVGGIFTAQSGQPFTPIIAPDPLGLNSADAWDFPNVTPGCKTTNPGNVSNYLNLSCFTLPTAPASFASQCATFPGAGAPPPSGQVYCANLLGNEVRNSVIGPGFFNLDFSVFKNNYIKAISETFNLQARVEFFNALNHASFLEPIDNSTLFNNNGTPIGGAGSIDTLTVPAREIQFGLKVIW